MCASPICVHAQCRICVFKRLVEGGNEFLHLDTFELSCLSDF